MEKTKTEKRKRGLACLSPERRREIASMGGKSVPPEKRAFARDAELAKQAGRVGGAVASPENRMFHKDKDLARRAAQVSAAGRSRRSALKNPAKPE
jgi:general stress protein YciG